MKKFAAAGAILLLTGMFIYTKPIFNLKLSASSFFGSIVSFGSSNFEERIKELERENAFLKEELKNTSDIEIESIKVYSSYPFNSRSEIAIAAGGSEGIQIGDIATFGGDALVGRVTRVSQSSSIVTTIFDPTQEIAVRIGDREIDALLHGGNELNLTLIPFEEEVQAGDVVRVASEGFPYGLEVGTVREVKEGEEGVFKEAVLSPSFSLKKLRDVILIK